MSCAFLCEVADRDSDGGDVGDGSLPDHCVLPGGWVIHTVNPVSLKPVFGISSSFSLKYVSMGIISA